MDISSKIFQRLFSFNMYKSLRLPLGHLSFDKNFINIERGDLYPLISKSLDGIEAVRDNKYIVESGKCERLMGRFFPYATYELTFTGCAGLSFNLKDKKASIKAKGKVISFDDGDFKTEIPCEDEISSLIITCRPGAFDIYTYKNGKANIIKTVEDEKFIDSNLYKEFTHGFVSFFGEGECEITDGCFYLDSGVSIADMRPITYEDGTAIIEGGKIFFTASIRTEGEPFQGVYSWTPGTADFELVGALFYDAGDQRWCNDVAASIVFNRFTNKWNLWVCSFYHRHILGSAEFEGDPRFGINAIDITLMDEKGSFEDSDFLGKEGDEDPAFIYDKENERWLMAICRLEGDTKKYRYVFYESDNPFTGFKFIGKGLPGEETGGSFVNIEGKIHFICGNSFKEKSDYRIYNKDGMKNAKFDFPDGGFRGWGTVIPVKKAGRCEYYWLTFDRTLGSAYNWSYGNLYCFKLVF